MLVKVNGIYYVHVCEQARWARSEGNRAIQHLCIIIIKRDTLWQADPTSLPTDFINDSS